MNELQSVTDIDEVIKYAEREAEGCHQMASAYHTDEGVYLQEETRCQYKAILWENIHEWLEELKELRKKQRPHREWIFAQRGKFVDLVCPLCKEVSIDDLAYNITAEEAKKRFFDGEYTIHGKTELPHFCPNCGSDNRKKEDKPHGS